MAEGAAKQPPCGTGVAAPVTAVGFGQQRAVDPGVTFAATEMGDLLGESDRFPDGPFTRLLTKSLSKDSNTLPSVSL